ncbi:MAG: serine/threonine protein kinase [Armatimonadetes bacterium]|nr:serine/threonine protein kinase [Armatimonadota bacterium]
MMKARLTPGTVLDGRYRVDRLIKAGGMGAVYVVTDRSFNGKAFALKEMIDPSTDPGERQEAKTRFISEIQVMQSLLHPNIPKVSSSFIHDNSFYFVMELVEGTDLSRVLKATGGPGLAAANVVNWAVQVLDALDYLHGLTPPVVHRDIKPSNLLYRERDDRIMLIDFGIARVTNPAEGFWIGTPGYAPPEQQYGRPEPRSDLYALGATMHELLTGVKPRGLEFPSFEELGVKVDSGLKSVIAHALMHFPDERIRSAREMSARLQALEAFTISVPTADREHDFEAAVQELKKEIVDPMLGELIRRYSHECHTPYLPKKLDYLQFTLACPTTFELHVVKDSEREVLRFLEKQGLLDPTLLGEVEPLQEGASTRARSIIERFGDDYEQFRGANWQVLS